MLKIILFIIFIVVAIVSLISHLKEKKKENQDDDKIFFTKIVSVAATLALVITTVISGVYTQEVGEVKIIKNFTGTVAGISEDAGLHAKLPWQSTISYDVRNMMINFYGEADYVYEGGNAEGAAVSVNDKAGVQASVDIQVEYSLNAEAAKNLYENYGSQESFVEKFLSNDLRAVARKAAAKFDTMQMLTDRSSFAKAVEDELRTAWSVKGLTVERVNVQAVNYEASITDAYAKAQAAEIAKSQAQKQQEVELIEAETEVKVAELNAQKLLVEAEGQVAAAEAVNGKLSSAYLEYLYIQAMNNAADKGCLVIGGNSVAIQR